MTDTEHIGDLTIRHFASGCLATLNDRPLPGAYADTEAAVIASRMPLGVLKELADRICAVEGGRCITEEDLTEAELGISAEAEVGLEMIDDPQADWTATAEIERAQ